MGGEHLMKARLAHPPCLLVLDAQLLSAFCSCRDLLTSAAGHLSPQSHDPLHLPLPSPARDFFLLARSAAGRG